MSWRAPAFLPPTLVQVPWSTHSTRQANFFQPWKRRTLHRPLRISRLPLRARLGPPEIPDEIKELDELERQRRANLDSEPPRPRLSDDTRAILFAKFPDLKQLHDEMEGLMQENDYDPTDYRVYSWAYDKMRPWAPSRLLQLLCVLATFYAVRAVFLLVRARYSIPVICAALVQGEFIALLALTVILPAVFCAWAMFKGPEDFQTDGVRRIAVMHVLSSTLLLPVAAVASVGHAVPAAILGLGVRLLPMAMSLWYWHDLNSQLDVGTVLLARVFRAWRLLATFFVILVGSCIRIAGLVPKLHFPTTAYLADAAHKMRVKIGQRLPVAFSLFNDPRGLFFGACLALAVGVMYDLYVFVFVTDFTQNRNHRKVSSLFSSAMLRANVYAPNEHPLKAKYRITGPAGQKSFTPSPAMMLRKQDDLLTPDSGLTANEYVMPIFSLLEQEDEISEKEGIDKWMKPRDEQIPLSDDLSRLKRTKDALMTWARPLEGEEMNMSFAEFFDTLEDNEYQYDSASGDWVFSEDRESEKEDEETARIMENIMNAKDETEVSTADLEKIIGKLSAMDIEKLASSPELGPILRGQVIDETPNAGDDPDDPSRTVYV